MKKLVSVLVALTLTVALSVPAFAVGYVNSVTASGAPSFVGGSVGSSELKKDDVVVTPAAGTEDKELQDVYNELAGGNANISADLGSQLGGKYTATEVFKVESSSGSSVGEIAPGESVELTFDVGVDVHSHMVAARMVDGEWVNVGDTVNNGDGTVTVVTDEMGTICLFTVTPENEELVTIEKEEGTDREIAGFLVDHQDELLSVTYQDCIIVTPIEDVSDSFYMTSEDKLAMKEFDEGIKNGEIILSEKSPELNNLVKEKFGSEATADELSLLELIDVKVICHELSEHLPPENTTVTLTFDVKAAADQEVFVVTYKHGEVVLADNVINNGDGTVTATFENFCPVAFFVKDAATEVVGGEGECALCKGFFGAAASPIASLCVVCFVIILAVVVAVAVVAYLSGKKKDKKETK